MSERKKEPLVMVDATVGEVMVQLIERVLGTNITDHVKVKGIKLVLESDSYEWAGQIKFLEQQICKELYPWLGIETKGIEVLIRRTRNG
jgi:hypothetical protein